MPNEPNVSERKQMHLLCQEVWRKAFKEGSLVLKFKSKSERERMRMGLYNAVRGFRRHPESYDAELLKAAYSCRILRPDGFEEGDEEFSLLIQNEDEDELLKDVAEQLGTTVREIVDKSGKQTEGAGGVLEAAERMWQELNGEKPTNKYFNWEE